MKSSFLIKLATLAALTASAIAPLKPAAAVNFDEFAVDQSKFVAVAVPYNYRRFRLAIIEQVPGQQPCWRESGSNPATVDLLLLNFDHTNSCRKAVDTNGYSLRVNGQDDKVAYVLNLFEHNGELQLVADHRDPSQPDLVIGRTGGLREAPLKINLDPNWQFTKRLYQGSALQHIYLSNNPSPQVLENVATLPTTNDPAQNTPSAVTPAQPTPQPTIAQPLPAPTTSPNAVQGLVSSILTPLAEAVYQTYNSLFTLTPSTSQSQFLPTPINALTPAESRASCAGGQTGMAIWNDTVGGSQTGSGAQETTISAEGILQLNDGSQIDIKPTLADNDLDLDDFLAGQNSAELDFDEDGEVEELKIVQSPEPCATPNSY